MPPELGNEVLGYWRQYMVTAESGDFHNSRFPKADSGLGDLEVVKELSCTLCHTTEGRKLCQTRKWTKNLFDLTNLWKKTVINQLEDDASRNEDQTADMQLDIHAQANEESGQEELILHRSERDRDPFLDLLHPSLPKAARTTVSAYSADGINR
ncbi:hypothetical protein B0H14DRAFT_2567473 [Mycena olivaceomarginata]|nr:hypothetical protein B0H14DRAFT_2567473 [Mycena olivaceomarginata]